MNDSDGLRQEIAALRERNSSLHAAILRISASLDLDTVLRELVASACALIGARYGMIATVDDDGEIEKFIAPGLSAHERRHMAQWPHRYQFFAHLRDLPGPLRLADVPAYVRSLGYTDDFTLSNTLLATPIRHAGVHVGIILPRREGGRGGVYGRGRGDPGDVRLAGGDGDCQRPQDRRGASAAGVSGDPDGDHAGGCGGDRCHHRQDGGLGSRRASAQRGEPDREQLAGLRRQGGFDAARTFAVGALHAPRCHGAGGLLRLGVNGARSLSIHSQPKENQQ